VFFVEKSVENVNNYLNIAVGYKNNKGLLSTYCQKDESFRGGDTMLRVIHSMAELPFGKLMEIYAQSNLERGRLWSNESPDRQIDMAEREVYAYLRQCFFTRPGSCYFIWEEQERALCAVRCESYADGVLLTSLETAPNYRGRGYATQLLGAVLMYLEAGKVYVHIHINNQASLSVHLKCGFQKVKSGARMLDGSYSREYDTYLTEIP